MVLLGHCLDLAGTELPYHPFVEALRPWGQPWADVGETGFGSQLRVFERTASLLGDHAATDPVLLVLEDVHWADVSTIDLTVYLAHHVDDLTRPAGRDRPGRRDRLTRPHQHPRRRDPALGDGSRGRPGSSRHRRRLWPCSRRREHSAARDGQWPRRSWPAAEGNPFFAEELLTVAGGSERASSPSACATCCCTAPRARPGRARPAAGGCRGGPGGGLRRAVRGGRAPEAVVRESLRQGVERGILVVGPDGDSVRFRHALLAEAVYTTVLPGEREDLHARVAAYLADRPRRLAGGAGPTLDRRRPPGRRPARVDRGRAPGGADVRVLPRRTATSNGPSHCGTGFRRRRKSRGSSSRRSALGPPDWPSHVGAATRAVELARRAIELTPDDPGNGSRSCTCGWASTCTRPPRTAPHSPLVERAVAADARAPRRPASGPTHCRPLAGGLMVLWRFAESLPLAREALGAGAGGGCARRRRCGH